MNVKLTINNQTITVPDGQKLLWAALDNGIYIPNLCAIKARPEPDASCRLCWVEIEGQKEPVPACAVVVKDGMVVNTNGEKSFALARAGFELLMASHALDCPRCTADGKCELQKIAKVLKCSLKPKELRLILRNFPIDDTNPTFTLDPNKCVLCGHCVYECGKQGKKAVLGFAYRGFNRVITTFGDEAIGKECAGCGECIKVCPTGALAGKK
jgi:bidirectional [NiFe] hydrogenase diaphorase subunit